MASAKETAVTEKVTNLPTTGMDFEADANKGIEQVTAECMAIPMLKVLQALSPQCEDGSGIEGAKAGMLYNTVTNEVYDGTKGVRLIPCYFKQSFIEWVPRNAGGGFVGEHEPGSPVLDEKRRSDDGRDVLPNGHEIEDSRNHYCLLVNDDDTFQPVLLSLSVTQTPASKKWLTRIDNIKKTGKNGIYTPPSFSHIYKLTTTKRKNDKGSWYVPDIDMLEEITEPMLYFAGKDLYEKVKKGRVEARQEDREDGRTTHSTTSGADDDEVPF